MVMHNRMREGRSAGRRRGSRPAAPAPMADADRERNAGGADGENGKRVGRPKGTGGQRVYAKVREDILRLKLPPGADLDESTLEREFGLSRTPVREALIRLASEGLITLLPNRGARVTPIDISDVPHLFEALELCQRATSRWVAARHLPEEVAQMRLHNGEFLAAAQRGDTERMGDTNKEFHLVFARACDNRYLGRFYESLLTISLRLARTVFAYAPQAGDSPEDYYMEIVRQHEAMIERVEQGDVEGADALARKHTDLFKDRVMRYVNSKRASTLPLGADR